MSSSPRAERRRSRRLAWAVLASLLVHCVVIGGLASPRWWRVASQVPPDSPLEVRLAPPAGEKIFPLVVKSDTPPEEDPERPETGQVPPFPLQHPDEPVSIEPAPQASPPSPGEPVETEAPESRVPGHTTTGHLAQRLPPSGTLVYQFYWGRSRWLAGLATHQWVIENGYYTLTSSVTTTGLFGLIHPTRLVETSQGSVVGDRLRPQMFVTQLNEFAPAIAYFNWHKGHFRWYRGAISFTQPLPADAYDKISFLYQLYLTPNWETFHSVDITMGRRLEHYEIQNLGVDEIDIGGKVYPAIHLKRATTSAAIEQVEIWLSIDDNLPLRMIHSNNAGDQFEQLISADSIPLKSNPQDDPSDQD